MANFQKNTKMGLSRLSYCFTLLQQNDAALDARYNGPQFVVHVGASSLFRYVTGLRENKCALYLEKEFKVNVMNFVLTKTAVAFFSIIIYCKIHLTSFIFVLQVPRVIPSFSYLCYQVETEKCTCAYCILCLSVAPSIYPYRLPCRMRANKSGFRNFNLHVLTQKLMFFLSRNLMRSAKENTQN